MADISEVLQAGRALSYDVEGEGRKGGREVVGETQVQLEGGREDTISESSH